MPPVPPSFLVQYVTAAFFAVPSVPCFRPRPVLVLSGVLPRLGRMQEGVLDELVPRVELFLLARVLGSVRLVSLGRRLVHVLESCLLRSSVGRLAVLSAFSFAWPLRGH